MPSVFRPEQADCICVSVQLVSALAIWYLTTPFSFVASTNVILYRTGRPNLCRCPDLTPVISIPDWQNRQLRIWLKVDPGRSAGCRAKAGKPDRLLKPSCRWISSGSLATWMACVRLQRAHRVALIEDACEALGSEYRGTKVGTQGDMAVYAFYPNKQITTGEGGMIVTNDDQAAAMMQAMRNQGRAPGDTWLQHTYLGYNYRLNEFNAALGTVQMSRLEELLANREQVAAWYDQHLAGIPGVTRPRILPETTRMSWFVFIIWLEDEKTRDRVARELENRGIPVRPYFTPIHLQPYMVERFGYRKGDFPNTEQLGERGLALPFSGKMTEEMVAEVCDQLRGVL